MESGVLILLILGIGYAAAFNSYVILAPDTIRPGMEMTVKMNKLSDMVTLALTARVITNNNKLIVGKTANVGAAKSSFSMKLQIPSSLASAQYYLEVKGKVGKEVLFENSTRLTYLNKGMSVFVQTDKAIYKPGQLVKFRALGMTPDLKVVSEPMDISIYDPSNHKIAQWKNVTGAGGVFQGQMPLSDQPPLGDWKLQVEFESTTYSKQFTVDEYVLPTFEVTVELATFGVSTDKYLAGTVNARYTFGKPVEGNATMKIDLKSYYRASLQQYTLAFDVDGAYKFKVPVSELEQLFNSLSGNMFTVTVDVTERVTGTTLSGSSEIQYYDRAEKMQFMEGAENFKPGMTYTSYIYVSDQDDEPLPWTNERVTIEVTMYGPPAKEEAAGTTTDAATTAGSPSIPVPVEAVPQIFIPWYDYYNYGGEEVEEVAEVMDPVIVRVPVNGIIRYNIDVPIHVTRVEIKATFMEMTRTSTVEKFHSSSNNFIQVNMRTRYAEAEVESEFQVTTTESNVEAHYLIQSKGIVVDSGSLTIAGKSHTFEILMTAAMAPSARMLVYYVRPNGEIVADSVQFNVEGVFENRVSISYVNDENRIIDQVGPGDTVGVRVKADPDSTCHVLAIDKSVLLLKSGNDIDPAQVEEELEEYDRVAPSPCTLFPCLRSFFPIPIGGVDVTDIFKNSGMAILTDAILYEYVPPYVPRPMMFAMDSMAVSAVAVEETKIRTEFPETFLFDTVQTDDKGKAILRVNVPDTITSWIASAFAVNERSGLGVAPATASLEVFMKFFVRLQLPYSVVRGEQVILDAVVFNYFDEDLEVNVTMNRSPDFETIAVRTDDSGKKSKLVFTHVRATQTVLVPSKGTVSVKFPIRPVNIGMVDITVQANSYRAGDGLIKQLLVEAEGIPEEYTVPVLLDLREQSSFEDQIAIAIPEDAIEGSINIRASVIGDLMGPSISGITSLIKMPYGCGEQNMITFVPNIFAIKYLETINNLKTSDLSKAQEYMIAGYQKELTYQHYDGSFSAFGNNDPSGSTWLTAFVVKSFAQASPYIYIDPAVVRSAINWLLNQFDTESGTFNEPGNVIHKEMQGSSATGKFNLASYVLIALLEARQAGFSGSNQAFMTTVIDDAVLSLGLALRDMDNVFEIAITGYALALAGDSGAQYAVTQLNEQAVELGGMTHWELEHEPTDPVLLRYCPQARSTNIETTAYVLLIHAVATDVTSGLDIIKWLVRQRNANGGFGSTQDTVVALQALAEFGALIHSNEMSMTVTVGANPSQTSQSFQITQENALLLQTANLDPSSSDVTIAASGSGMALVQVSVSYNVLADPVEPQFTLNVKFTDETMNGFKVKICFSYIPLGVSGMSVMEVGILSGFAVDSASIDQLDILKRIENGERVLNLYFQEVTNEKTCISIPMTRQGLVAGAQPAVVKLYDYYQPENRVIGMYQPELLGNSDVCDLGVVELGCE